MSLRDVDETRQPSLTLYLSSHHKARVCFPSRYLCFSSAFLGALPLYFESETLFSQECFQFSWLVRLAHVRHGPCTGAFPRHEAMFSWKVRLRRMSSLRSLFSHSSMVLHTYQRAWIWESRLGKSGCDA